MNNEPVYWSNSTTEEHWFTGLNVKTNTLFGSYMNIKTISAVAIIIALYY